MVLISTFTIVISLYDLLWFYLACVGLVSLICLCMYLDDICGSRPKKFIVDVPLKEIFYGILTAPYILFIMCRESVKYFEKYGVKHFFIQRKWYRKMIKGDFYYVEGTYAKFWVKNDGELNYSRKLKYEAHSKRRSYEYDL